MILQDYHKALFPAGLSISSTGVSVAPRTFIPMDWFANTLPLVQWLAAFVGIVSGAVAVTWVIYQYFTGAREK